MDNDMNFQHLDNDERKVLSGCKGYIHVIKEGDTLYNLSKLYDVKVMDLLRLNPYVNVYNLQVGDEICIPIGSAVDEKKFVVRDGDTLSDVIRAFDLPFETITKYNPQLNNLKLPGGMIIRVPQRMPRMNVEEK